MPVDGDKEPKHTWHVEMLPSSTIIDGIRYGTAVIKKSGSWAVTLD